MNLVIRIKGLMLGAGAEWVMWMLLGLSVVSLAIALERFIYFARRRGNVHSLRRKLGGELRHGRIDAARAALMSSAHPAAKVVLRGMERAADKALPTQIEQAMQAESLAQKAHLESRLSFLGTLGSNAPFIGLFGTVIGIVGAFEQLGSGAGSMVGQGSSSELVMAAIAEALVATAVGIGVAIPAIFFFNYFLREVKRTMSGADLLARELLASLPTEGAPSSGRGAATAIAGDSAASAEAA